MGGPPFSLEGFKNEIFEPSDIHIFLLDDFFKKIIFTSDLKKKKKYLVAPLY